MILITTAGQKEYETVVKLCEKSSLKKLKIIETGTGKISSYTSVLAEMISPPKLIINIGVVQSLKEYYKPGKILEVDCCCEWDINYSIGQFDKVLDYKKIVLDGEFYPDKNSPFNYSWCATGDLILGPNLKDAINSLDYYGICDMELFPQVLIGKQAKVPVLSFKVVGNYALEEDHLSKFSSIFNNLEEHFKPIIDYLEDLVSTDPKFAGF